MTPDDKTSHPSGEMGADHFDDPTFAYLSGRIPYASSGPPNTPDKPAPHPSPKSTEKKSAKSPDRAGASKKASGEVNKPITPEVIDAVFHVVPESPANPPTPVATGEQTQAGEQQAPDNREQNAGRPSPKTVGAEARERDRKEAHRHLMMEKARRDYFHARTVYQETRAKLVKEISEIGLTPEKEEELQKNEAAYEDQLMKVNAARRSYLNEVVKPKLQHGHRLSDYDSFVQLEDLREQGLASSYAEARLLSAVGKARADALISRWNKRGTSVDIRAKEYQRALAEPNFELRGSVEKLQRFAKESLVSGAFGVGAGILTGLATGGASVGVDLARLIAMPLVNAVLVGTAGSAVVELYKEGVAKQSLREKRAQHIMQTMQRAHELSLKLDRAEPGSPYYQTAMHEWLTAIKDQDKIAFPGQTVDVQDLDAAEELRIEKKYALIKGGVKMLIGGVVASMGEALLQGKQQLAHALLEKVKQSGEIMTDVAKYPIGYIQDAWHRVVQQADIERIKQLIAVQMPDKPWNESLQILDNKGGAMPIPTDEISPATNLYFHESLHEGKVDEAITKNFAQEIGQKVYASIGAFVAGLGVGEVVNFFNYKKRRLSEAQAIKGVRARDIEAERSMYERSLKPRDTFVPQEPVVGSENPVYRALLGQLDNMTNPRVRLRLEIIDEKDVPTIYKAVPTLKAFNNPFVMRYNKAAGEVILGDFDNPTLDSQIVKVDTLLLHIDQFVVTEAGATEKYYRDYAESVLRTYPRVGEYWKQPGENQPTVIVEEVMPSKDLIRVLVVSSPGGKVGEKQTLRLYNFINNYRGFGTLDAGKSVPELPDLPASPVQPQGAPPAGKQEQKAADGKGGDEKEKVRKDPSSDNIARAIFLDKEYKNDSFGAERIYWSEEKNKIEGKMTIPLVEGLNTFDVESDDPVLIAYVRKHAQYGKLQTPIPVRVIEFFALGPSRNKSGRGDPGTIVAKVKADLDADNASIYKDYLGTV